MRTMIAGLGIGRPSAVIPGPPTWRLTMTPAPIADGGIEWPPKEVVVAPAAATIAVRSRTLSAPSRIAAVDYLRAVSIVLVVAVHSAAGYAVTIPASHPHHSWLAGAPVADSHRLVGVDLFL